jgi:sec-independent protein translocase protein TatA
MFGSFGWMELLLILFIVLIVFGAGKLPQLGEGVGKAIKGFKRSVNEAEPTAEDAIAQGDAPPTTPPAQPGAVSAQTPVATPDAGSPQAGP